MGEKATLLRDRIGQYLCDPISSGAHSSRVGLRIAS
jgi:hypothetical protein